MRLDHLVIWAEDPVRTVEFFEQTIGFAPVRLEEFKAKKVMFPSVRVNEDTIIDVMPKAMAPKVDLVVLTEAAAAPLQPNLDRVSGMMTLLLSRLSGRGARAARPVP